MDGSIRVSRLQIAVDSVLRFYSRIDMVFENDSFSVDDDEAMMPQRMRSEGAAIEDHSHTCIVPVTSS
jgi:hypothetical protein